MPRIEGPNLPSGLKVAGIRTETAGNNVRILSNGVCLLCACKCSLTSWCASCQVNAAARLPSVASAPSAAEFTSIYTGLLLRYGQNVDLTV